MKDEVLYGKGIHELEGGNILTSTSLLKKI